MDTKMLLKSFYLLTVQITHQIVVVQHLLWTQFAQDLYQLPGDSLDTTRKFAKPVIEWVEQPYI
jgi:hypothetical protein